MCTIVKTMKCCAVRNIKMGSVHMLKLVMFSGVAVPVASTESQIIECAQVFHVTNGRE